MSGSTTTIVKSVKVDLDRCIGCRACEVACSGFHASPKFSSINPARSRIRMFVDEMNDVYVPIFAGYRSTTECSVRHDYRINDKHYSECSLCRSSCPARDLFNEPDSGLPLKCDMCEGEVEPKCVQVCRPGALTYMEREKELKVEPGLDEMEVGLQSLIGRHGLQNIMDEVTRISKKW